MLTPEERAAIELQIADLTARMETLDHLCNQNHIPEWAAFYDILEKRLD